MESEFRIKIATHSDMDIFIDWAAQEGWNPGLNDAQSYYLCDQGGFLLGFLSGQPIATISAVKYGKSFGFIGFYIVKEEYRGHGYGLQIWNAAMKSLEGRNIGLDGVVDQQSNYKKSGFNLDYRNIRFEGVTLGAEVVDNRIVEVSTLDFQRLEKYDNNFFPTKRTEFIRSWVSQPNSIALAFVENGKIKGYGVLRKCRNGYKIGPLYADASEIAESLLLSLQSGVEAGTPVFLDVSEKNKIAVSLAEKYGMKVSFETARMYTGEPPSIPLDNIYGVTSFEVG